eukprot:4340075-Alexandrium_andersonii.AAC.1
MHHVVEEGRQMQCIPIALHGDDASYSEADKLLVVHMHSVLVPDSCSVDACLPLFVIPFREVADGITLEMAYEELAFSGLFMDMGIQPTVDLKGRPMRPKPG